MSEHHLEPVGAECVSTEHPFLPPRLCTALREGFPEEVALGLGLQLAWQSMF